MKCYTGAVHTTIWELGPVQYWTGGANGIGCNAMDHARSQVLRRVS